MTETGSEDRLPRHLRPRAVARRARYDRIQRVSIGLWQGKTLDELAAAEGVGKRRLQRQMRAAGLCYPARANHALIGAFVARKHVTVLDRLARAMGVSRSDVAMTLLAAMLEDEGKGARRVYGKLLPKGAFPS